MYVCGRRGDVGEDRFGGICWDGLEVKTSGDGDLPVANATQIGRRVVMWGWSEYGEVCVKVVLVMRWVRSSRKGS